MVLVNEKQALLDEVGGPDWYLVSRVPCETGGWCRTILADDLVDLEGDVELLLAGRAAVLVRPDRYLFGSADDDSIGELVDAAKRLIGIETA